MRGGAQREKRKIQREIKKRIGGCRERERETNKFKVASLISSR